MKIGACGLLVLALVAPPQTQSPADRAEARTDQNSQTAHAELLTKAKTGRIDVYFVGDSITRRWAALDYPHFLEHWRQNFYGWNAANFGWGADKTQNILWRLENGELDGVNPTIVVVQAGTNNLMPAGSTTAANIARGVQAIVDLCRAKAPDATIVLTGIFPRNDHAGLWPEISGINEQLSKMADGTRIRYVDINNKLASSDGTLVEGMTVDGLHPTIKGYQVWADALKPMFREILGPPAAIDLAPPPTGDPSVRK